MFFDREVKCQICGSLLASYDCMQPANVEEDILCDECEKAVKDAKEQAKYLRDHYFGDKK